MVLLQSYLGVLSLINIIIIYKHRLLIMSVPYNFSYTRFLNGVTDVGSGYNSDKLSDGNIPAFV